MNSSFFYSHDGLLNALVRYWNLPYQPDEHNFVEAAVSRGYSVFLYDRLGIGSSSRYAMMRRLLQIPNKADIDDVPVFRVSRVSFPSSSLH